MANVSGVTYGVAVDRYSGWPIVWDERKTKLPEWLRSHFGTYGVPEHITTDGGPHFQSFEVKALLERFGVTHQTSSAYNPHGNTRAEVAVKSMKRLMADNLEGGGSLDSDKFVAAILSYRNTPQKTCKMSPAELVFGGR